MQVWTIASGNTAGSPREALEAVDDGQQDILDAAVPELVHHPEPELGAFVLLEPQAEHLLGAVGAHAERDVDRLVADHALVPDLDPQRVEEDQRVDGSSGRCCQAATSSSTASVTALIRSGETSMP